MPNGEIGLNAINHVVLELKKESVLKSLNMVVDHVVKLMVVLIRKHVKLKSVQLMEDGQNGPNAHMNVEKENKLEHVYLPNLEVLNVLLLMEV